MNNSRNFSAYDCLKLEKFLFESKNKELVFERFGNNQLNELTFPRSLTCSECNVRLAKDDLKR